MANNKHREYLIIAEVGRNGFVLGSRKKYYEAVSLANNHLLFGEIFHWPANDKIKEQMESRKYKSYQIKGNQLYFDNFLWVNSDGHFSICIIKTEVNKFCLQTFIRERENHSIVFGNEVCTDKRRRDFFDKFPRLSLISN